MPGETDVGVNAPRFLAVAVRHNLMTRQTTIILIAFIALTACSNPTTDKGVISSADTTVAQLADQNKTSSTNTKKDSTKTDTLPIHGELNQTQIDQYYPKILDTIKDRRIIGSEPIDIQTKAEIYVSMLHNAGTFDQMFLCTHDKKLNLLDCYYIGTSTMFDGTSHTIEYKKVSDERLEFHHVDWGYVKNEIDTTKYQKYILTVTKTGKIEKK